MALHLKFLYSESLFIKGRNSLLFLKREIMARTLSAPGTRPGPHVKDSATLGSIIRHRRLELTLRIDDAAHACGVAPSVLSRLENGGAVGSDRLLRILAGLGLAMAIAATDETVLLQPDARAQSFKTWSDAANHFKSYFVTSDGEK
jgi:transcriptional regulator with XRE-family HTH domain